MEPATYLQLIRGAVEELREPGLKLYLKV